MNNHSSGSPLKAAPGALRSAPPPASLEAAKIAEPVSAHISDVPTRLTVPENDPRVLVLVGMYTGYDTLMSIQRQRQNSNAVMQAILAAMTSAGSADPNDPAVARTLARLAIEHDVTVVPAEQAGSINPTAPQVGTAAPQPKTNLIGIVSLFHRNK